MKRVVLFLTSLILITCIVYMLPALWAILILLLGIWSYVRRPRIPDALIILLLSCYIFWVISALSSFPVTDQTVIYNFLRWHVRGFLGYIPLIAFFMLGVSYGPTDMKKLFYSLQIPAMLVAVMGIVQLMSGWIVQRETQDYVFSPMQSQFGETWFFGFMRSHEAAGGIYFTIAITALVFYIFHECPKKEKALNLILFFINTYALMLTKARTYIGAYIFTFMLIIFIVLFRRAIGKPLPQVHIFKRALASFVISCIFFLAIPDLHSRFEHIYRAERTPIYAHEISQITVIDRFSYWKGAIDLFCHHPLVGVGLGNFPKAFLALDNSLNYTPQNIDMIHAHNSYLQMAAETGVIGLLPFLTLWALLALKLFSNTNKHDVLNFNFTFSLAVFAAVMGHLAAAFFDHNLWSPQIMIPLTSLAGIVLYSVRHEER